MWSPFAAFEPPRQSGYNPGAMQALFRLLARSPRPLLIIGGQALTAYGLFRQTIDVDCLIAAGNETALSSLLRSNGYGEMARSENFVRFHSSETELPDLDILLVDTGTFEKLAAQSRILRRGDEELRVPSLAHLIALKFHAIKNNSVREGRDLGDIGELVRLNPHAISRDEIISLCRQFAPPNFEAKLLSFL